MGQGAQENTFLRPLKNIQGQILLIQAESIADHLVIEICKTRPCITASARCAYRRVVELQIEKIGFFIGMISPGPPIPFEYIDTIPQPGSCARYPSLYAEFPYKNAGAVSVLKVAWRIE